MLTIFDKFLKLNFKKSLFEVEIFTNNSVDFYIELYDNKNIEIDKKFISSHRKDIKQFFDEGYESAGLGSFLSCMYSSSIKNNTYILKIARHKETQQILAMTIYNNFGGSEKSKKCVGATILKTNDTDLKNLAKKALEFIIKEDVHCQTDFYWCECSGVISHYWQKHGGIKLPNAYLPMFMTHEQLKYIEIIDNDIYKYNKIIAKNTDKEFKLEKCIYGFPNKEVLEKYLNDINMDLDKFIDKLYKKYNINESNISVEFTKPEIDIEIINYFYQKQDESIFIFDLTEYEYKILYQAITNIQSYLNMFSDILTYSQKTKLEQNHDNGVDMLIISCILKPYKLGTDYLITHDLDKTLFNLYIDEDEKMELK